jgi:SAM-dependent methyltransferase
MLDAFDRGDAAAVAAITTPSFVRFEVGKVHERAAELARLRPRTPDFTRTWKDEHVYVGASDATFIGLAAEHEIGNDSHGNREYDGWYTVAWTRDGGAWKVAHWTWQPYRSALDFQREHWNDDFRQDVGFTHDPNQLLVTATAGAPPGAALDLATGQGRNALHLASHGWTVTAVDISDEGLRRAREAAARAHVALDTVQADIDTYDYGVGKWDLVTEIYVPDPVARAGKIKAALRPGGLFVLEFFLDEGDGGVKPAELRAQFTDGFDILRDEVVDDRPDWGQDRAKLVRFVARKR